MPPGAANQQEPPLICHHCGLTNRAQAKFCSDCGYPLQHQVAPSLHPPVSPSPQQQLPVPRQPTGSLPHRLVELWWLRIPISLRRSSVLLSEIWRDGLYLSAIPWAATLLPLLLFFFGALEGMTHWNPMDNPYAGGETLVPFTELFPLLILTVVASAFSMNVGLTIVLGYVLGDILNSYGPHLISYVIFGLLVVLPTLCAKTLTKWLRNLPQLAHSTSLRVVLQTTLGACIQGGIVYVWIQATPLLIRTFWGWGWDKIFTTRITTPAAMYYLQQPEMSTQLIRLAVIAFMVRNVLEYRASRNPSVRQREERLTRGLTEADAHPGILRRLPPFVRALVPAGLMTVVLGGILTDQREGLVFFLFLWFLLIMQGTILPSFGFWMRWTQLVTRVPVLMRLLVALFIISLLAGAMINLLWNQPTLFVDTPSASFEPYLLTTGIAVTIMALLLPQTKQHAQPGSKSTN